MLGGMLTAQGVCATDGNFDLPSGLWNEFRDHLRKRYGGIGALWTGWVSTTLFEPHVADSIFHTMAAAEPTLEVVHGYRLTGILRRGKRITGAEFTDARGGRMLVRARITVDATDLGDALPLHLIPSWHGRPRRHGRRAGSGRGQRRGAGPHGGGHPQGLRARRGPNHRAACGLRPRGVRRVLRPLVGRGAQRRPDARIRPYAGRQIHDQLAQGGQRHQPRRGGTSPCRAHSGPRSGAAEDPALRLPHPARAGIPPPRHR